MCLVSLDLFHSFAAEVVLPKQTRVGVCAVCVSVGQGGNSRHHRFKWRENDAVFA